MTTKTRKKIWKALVILIAVSMIATMALPFANW